MGLKTEFTVKSILDEQLNHQENVMLELNKEK